MFLKTLSLTNFRNYTQQTLNFDKQKTILVGSNAQGKTNILEAVILLSTLQSNRASVDGELIKFGEPYTLIKANVITETLEHDLEIALEVGKRKILKVNGIKKKHANEFLGRLVTVSFSISDMMIIRGTPSDRRKWLDSCICQIYPSYYSHLHKFNKIKTQRNAFLKSLKGYLNSSNMEVLTIWNEQLVISGSNIIRLRTKFLNEIYPIARQTHNNMSHQAETLQFNYVSSFSEINDSLMASGKTIEEIVTIYKESLQMIQDQEVFRCQTLLGPHRDDIEFIINEKDIRLYGSQGQQRTLVIALKLSEIELIKTVLKDTPVLLMDDVMAELDLERQHWLIDSITDTMQIIMTTTHLSNFDADWIKTTQILTVQNGNIQNSP